MRAATRRGGAATLLIAWGCAAAGCSLLPAEAPLLRAEDCFGRVPYAFSGWTTLEAIGLPHGPNDGPADGRVYAMVTLGEVQLDVSPPAADGSTSSVMGRGACWSWPGAPGTSKRSIGAITLVPNP
ncbi:MAG TPA: hypothetical protein VES19_13905 [Candidatus Limnocylindrales bacterium]|nr:hypothetical protein [Candidatus Limnocylindrales bacterium]